MIESRQVKTVVVETYDEAIAAGVETGTPAYIAVGKETDPQLN